MSAPAPGKFVLRDARTWAKWHRAAIYVAVWLFVSRGVYEAVHLMNLVFRWFGWPDRSPQLPPRLFDSYLGCLFFTAFIWGGLALMNGFMCSLSKADEEAKK